MAAPKYKQVELNVIQINRDLRQRRDLGDIESLADSIRRIGLINPITVTKDLILIAGERRLEACRSLGLDKIPARFYEELDDSTKQIIELEENVKREELSWQDRALSIKKINDIYREIDKTWTLEKTGQAVGLKAQMVSNHILVATRVEGGDSKIAACDSLKSAMNIIERETSRALDNELNNLIEVEREDEHDEAPAKSLGAGVVENPRVPERKRADVLNGSFTEWVRSYSDRRFNLIHCDFPYGIDHQDSAQGGTASGKFSSYEDSEETYWSLCKALAKNLDKLMTASGHLMFWFSMNYYQATIDFFEDETDLELVMPQPLIWYKSDGKGIASDVNRRPRNVYEVALLFSRGDRKIITPVDNCYACPTSKNRLHASEKPEPMLRHFFRMFIDSYSEMLDPTCGTGSALRAADSLGAKRIQGVELDKEFAAEAESLLLRSRTLEKLSSEVRL